MPVILWTPSEWSLTYEIEHEDGRFVRLVNTWPWHPDNGDFRGKKCKPLPPRQRHKDFVLNSQSRWSNAR